MNSRLEQLPEIVEHDEPLRSLRRQLAEATVTERRLQNALRFAIDTIERLRRRHGAMASRRLELLAEQHPMPTRTLDEAAALQPGQRIRHVPHRKTSAISDLVEFGRSKNQRGHNRPAVRFGQEPSKCQRIHGPFVAKEMADPSGIVRSGGKKVDPANERVFDTRMHQASLFATGPASAEVDFGRVERLEMGAGAWIDHGPHVLGGADAWFDELTRSLPWRTAQRPMYDRVVDVPRLIVDFKRHAAPADLARLWSAFENFYGRSFRSVGCNWYRSGRDSVAWHADRVPDPNDAIIAILAVGERRPFLIRPIGGGPSTRFMVGDGDLLVLGGTFQAHWQHCVPKIAPSARGAGERVSIMIRG